MKLLIPDMLSHLNLNCRVTEKTELYFLVDIIDTASMRYSDLRKGEVTCINPNILISTK